MATDPQVDVLQVITTTGRRGAEVFAAALAPELEQRGLSVRTVALVEGEGPTLDVEALGTNRLGRRTLQQLRQAARHASVVIAHGSSTLPASALATTGTGVPFVYRNIGDPAYWSTSRWRRLRSRILLSRSAAVVALTPETGRRLGAYYGVPSAKITPIPRAVSGVEFPLRTPQDRDRARIALGIRDPEARVALCLGALSPEKDVGAAVAALSHLPERWLLVIAGDGPDRAAIERAAAPLGPRILMVGQVDHGAEVIAAADVLVLASRTEGLPGVVIEAAMRGVPAVATDVGFVAEIIDDGVTGRLVPPADPAALARAVLEIEPLLTSMGAAAHERALGTYSLQAAADRWYAVMAPFIERGGRAAT